MRPQCFNSEKALVCDCSDLKSRSLLENTEHYTPPCVHHANDTHNRQSFVEQKYLTTSRKCSICCTYKLKANYLMIVQKTLCHSIFKEISCVRLSEPTQNSHAFATPFPPARCGAYVFWPFIVVISDSFARFGVRDIINMQLNLCDLVSLGYFFPFKPPTATGRPY